MGTGLGLAIVKELAEGMGGSIGASANPDSFTVFTMGYPSPAAGGPQHTNSDTDPRLRTS